ncbi:AzlD domain-containing protein [Sinorhizobium sp. BG8]|uniref:AzlD family protein n=1 Tax=Sinorhizobium sp. BG8 TaxID=2613773 RepID=UPI00193DFEBF|nr:AzlD domain-containing protein [Sinorhizobium sp. BG8]QRM54865.1 AzlD family protein [Sinorhizobium sp. BG8]
MTLDPHTLLAILAMAVATMMMRLAGLVLVRHVALGDRGRKAIESIPPAVLISVVAPTALATGLVETIGCAITALAALRLPMLAAAALGVVSVAALRAAGL